MGVVTSGFLFYPVCHGPGMLPRSMRRALDYWPEVLLACMLLFFCLRELGTFPAPWEDDGIFMIVARMVAENGEYLLPVLGHHWSYPSFLGVGPTLILPVAGAMKLFGITVAAARVPMVVYLVATSIATYMLAYRLGSSRWNARWATALLITLSAFINTGKPVLGEIPAMFFVLAGLLVWQSFPVRRSHVWAGVLLGLAVVTKLSYAVVPVAGGIALLWFLIKREYGTARGLLVVLCASALPVAAWYGWMAMQSGGVLTFIRNWSEGCGAAQSILFHHPAELLRLPYALFLIMFVSGMRGLWISRHRLGQDRTLLIGVAIVLFSAYFLIGQGWYRNLLPAHLLLLPFVPIGLASIISARMAAYLMLLIAIAQGLWQWDHRGSSISAPETIAAAQIIARDYAHTPIIIRNAELYVQLPSNARWLYLPDVCNASYVPAEISTLSARQQCMIQVRRTSVTDKKMIPGAMRDLLGGYKLFVPADGC